MSATPDSFLPTQPPQRTTALSLREAAMLQTGVLRDTATDTADDSLDIKALLRILNKYKWLLLAFALLGLAASVVKTLTSTPLYGLSDLSAASTFTVTVCPSLNALN